MVSLNPSTDAGSVDTNDGRPERPFKPFPGFPPPPYVSGRLYTFVLIPSFGGEAELIALSAAVAADFVDGAATSRKSKTAMTSSG